LKPRPGRSGQGVAAHQRGRIHAATIELVAEAGYGELTATGIAGVAGVSKRTFYENFEDKQGCFFATYDLIVRHTAREVLAAERRAGDWQQQLCAGFGAFAREVAEQPQAARLALVEVFAAGPPAFERMRHTRGLFEALVADSFARPRDGVQLSPLLIRAIVAGETRVARSRLLAGRERELPEQADALMRWALSLRDGAARETCGGRPPLRLVRSPVSDRRPDAGEVIELAGDERGAILAAAADLTAKDGYTALTVTSIRRAAGVSRRRFEAHFEGVDDCFLAAVELPIGRAMARARAAFLSSESWPRAIYRGFAALCAQIAADPVLRRLAFFEVLAAGCEAVRWRARFATDLGMLIRHSSPPGLQPSELDAEASVGAVLALLHNQVISGRVSQLPQLAGTLAYLVLAPAMGAGASVEVIASERALAGRRSTPVPGHWPSREASAAY
jgi:AcrR family transcriptional regulator